MAKKNKKDPLEDIPTTIENGDKTYLPVSAFSKQITEEDGQNFMKIRILDPSPRLWHPIKKITLGEEKEKVIGRRLGRLRSVYIYDPNSEQRFITLDIGDLDEPGIQGIAFIRGVPSQVPIPEDNIFAWSDFRTQAIRIEYAVLGLTEQSSAEEKISKAIQHYSKDIINFLKREYRTLKDIDIEIKGNEFQLAPSYDLVLSPIPLEKIPIYEPKKSRDSGDASLLVSINPDALASEKIRVYEETKEKLDAIKARMEKKSGGNISYAQVIKRLVEHYEKARLLKKGMEEALAYSQKMLELALKNRPEIILAGGGITSGMPATAVPISTGRTTPGVPPPAPRSPPKETGNLRQDFKNEISAVLSGTPLTPQQVLALAKPKHSETAGPPVEETISQKAAKKAEEKMGRVIEPSAPVVPLPPPVASAPESPTPVISSDGEDEQLNPEINEQVLGKAILLLDTMIGRLESIDIDNPLELPEESLEEGFDATTIESKKEDSNISLTAEQKRKIEKWILHRIIDLQGIINEKELIEYKIPEKYRPYAPSALEVLAGKHLIIPSSNQKGWEANMKLITASAKDFPEYFEIC